MLNINIMEELEDMIRLISDDEEFRLWAFKYYDNPQAISLKEFKDDIKRFRYTKNLVEKYNVAYSNGRKLIDERLILNCITILHNLFGNFSSLGLFSKIEPKYWDILKTFLVFLNQMPKELDPQNKIKIDDEIMKKLEEL